MRWHARIFQSSIRFAFLTLWIGGVTLTPALAQDENESAGFRSTHVFEAGNFGESIDTLNGGLGADDLYGGAGSDTVTYASRADKVAVRLDGLNTTRNRWPGVEGVSALNPV